MNNETIFDDLSQALHDFGNEYAEIEGKFIATIIDEDELDSSLNDIVDSFALDIITYFEEAYSDGN